MGIDPQFENIRCTLASARRESNRRPMLAIQLLREIGDVIEQYKETPEWVEFSLLIGVAYSAMKDASAETHFQDAEEKAGKVPGLSAALRIRIYESFGEFYECDAVKQTRLSSGRNGNFWDIHERDARKLSLARSVYERGKEFAVRQHLKQDTARFQLKLICADLLIARDYEIENFQTLKRVAKDKSFTWTEQLLAWLLHPGKVAELERCTQFARHFEKMTDDYFLRLLRSIRNDQENREDRGEQLNLSFD